MWKQKWSNSGLELEAYDIAQGLYDSKVNIERPPSAAQQGIYTGSCRGPPAHATKGIKPIWPYSAKGRITSETSPASVPKTRPPWRPFSGCAALNQCMPFLATANKGVGDNETIGKEQNLCCELTGLPTVYQDRCLTNNMLFLKEYLTEDVPDNWPSCYRPKHSFVFLPCIESAGCVDLPVVPPVHQPDDLLIYNHRTHFKKYKPPRPRFKAHVEDKDGSRKDSDCVNVTSKLNQASKYDVYEGKRTADIIKQEIEDLERLLQGIGNPTGSSVVVRYQHDINHLRGMVKTTLEGYEFNSADVPRCLTPVAACFQEDLIRYPEQHETILKTIKQRRDQCVRELADIEHYIMSKTA